MVPNHARTVHVDLPRAAAANTFAFDPRHAVGVRARGVRGDAGARFAHVDQRMRTATCASGHQFTIEGRHAAGAETVVWTAYQAGRGHVKLSRRQRESRSETPTLDRSVIERTDGFVGRSYRARRIGVGACVETPWNAERSGEGRIGAGIVHSGGLVGGHVGKG